MRIAVIANDTIPGTAAALVRLRRAAKKLGIQLSDFAPPPTPAAAPKPDFYLVLGGDGSVLRALREIGASPSPAPLASVNTGTLGFLTCADAGGMEKALRALRDGEWKKSVRSMLEAACFAPDGGPLCAPTHALNDAVALRSESGQAATLSLEIDGAAVAEFVCDGMIVSTPTGSTAYALSAGGPIITPDAKALCVLPICPHTMTARPLVLPDDAEVTLRVARARAPLSFSCDGQVAAMLEPGAAAVIKRSRRKAVLAMLPPSTPFSVLSQKLNWGGRREK